MTAERANQSDDVENSAQNNADLFRQLQNGQTKALEVLYDRHAGLVYGIALKLLENTQEAEDLTQDIFISLTRKCAYNPQKGTLRTFLAILTRSRAIDRIRSRTRTHKRLLNQALAESSHPVFDNSLESVSEKERSQEVQAALKQLSDREQEVLRMSYYNGLSQSQIAAQLNIALGTVKSRSRSGLLKLRQALANLREGSK